MVTLHDNGSRMGFRIGIDVGGTFTDLVLVSPNGKLRLCKSPATPDDQSLGVLSGMDQLAREQGLSLADLLGRTASIVHGTTTADNTLIEMNGALTGLITTQGHRDEIELRRGFKENIWDPALPPPPPIAQRRRRIGVAERLDFEGRVLVPLDEDAVRAALRRLQQLGCESLAVVFLFSFLNSSHEERVREIAAQECPGLPLSLSYEVMPAAPEFERTSTTLVNAYVAPKIQRYLSHLVERLRSSGYRHELLVMQSNGGIMTPEYVYKRPVTVLGSGPAGGVVAACAAAATAKAESFVCADMGGTSYDVALIRSGRPEIKAGWNWQHRYLIGIPMVDVHSIGAGGGSIASVIAGSLKVGPRSAGARPGPICYGRGGQEITVTDANLLLGYLNPGEFCAGTMQLRQEGVAEAMLSQIARPLGVKDVEAAYGIYRLVNANMADAIRRIAAQRGVDPRTLTMVVYGGNGPLHAAAQAKELGIKRVLIPKLSPALSALGLLLSDPVVDEVRAYITPIDQVRLDYANALLAEMEAAARQALGPRFSGRRLQLRRFAHLCYPGQTFDMPVPMPGRGPLSIRTLRAITEEFHHLHEELHTYAAREEMPILRSLRVAAIGLIDKPSLPSIANGRRRPPRKGHRQAWFDGKRMDTAVYDGPRFLAGHSVRGPAIIEERFTTIVVHPDQRLRLDGVGNYEIQVA